MEAVTKARRIPLCIFATCLLAYLLVWSGHHYSFDGIQLFQTAKPLAFRGSLRMDPPMVWGSHVARVSRYGVGMPALYAPVLWLLDLTVFPGDPVLRRTPFQAGSAYNPALLADPAYRYASLLHPLVTALTAVLFYLLALRLGNGTRGSAAAALVYGLASPALPYARFDYSQPLCALLLLAAFYCLAAARGSGKTRWLLLAGVASGMLILTRAEFLVLLFGLLLPGILWIFAPPRRGGWRQGARAVAAYAAAAAPWILALPVLNRVRFGSWLSTGYSVAEFTFSLPRILAGLAGNLVSPGRGVLFFFPALLFALFCLPRARKDRLQAVMLAAAAAAFLFYSSRLKWGAGICWGPRFMVPYLPLLSLLGLSGFAGLTILSSRVKAVAAAVLVGLGGIFSLQGCLFNFLPYYNAIFRSGVRIGLGDYHFLWRHSPLLNGWKDLLRPEKYDIFWLRHAARGGGHWPLLVLLCGLGVCAVSWLRFFKEPAPPGGTEGA